MEDEIHFEDGNVTAIVRVGGTVRRAPGSWTPAVHALLRHLEDLGFTASPRVLGFDSQGREILTFIEGETIPASLAGFRSDALLAAVAGLLRLYHNATTTFVEPPDVRWRFQIGAPTTGDVICHNDIAPWNTVVQDGQPAAFIDWDLAARAPRTWDIAYALWRFIPLYDNESFGTPAEQGRRMKLFCDAYGLVHRHTLLATIERRQQVLYDTVVAWGKAGVPGFATLWRERHTEGVLRDQAYLRRYRTELEHGLFRL